MKDVIFRNADEGRLIPLWNYVQDLIRCKDCKYYDEEDIDNVCGRLCVYFAKPNDFCSKAERREEDERMDTMQ